MAVSPLPVVAVAAPVPVRERKLAIWHGPQDAPEEFRIGTSTGSAQPVVEPALAAANLRPSDAHASVGGTAPAPAVRVP
jgi:hypothetical protein